MLVDGLAGDRLEATVQVPAAVGGTRERTPVQSSSMYKRAFSPVHSAENTCISGLLTLRNADRGVFHFNRG